jgi:hypothetical protein
MLAEALLRIDPLIGYLRVTLMSEQQPKDATFGVLKSNDATPNSNSNGLGPILSSKFFHDPFDVHLNGFFSDYQPLANIAVAVAFGDSSKNFNFTLGKRFTAHVDRQILSEISRKMLASCVHLADDSDQLVERSALQQIAARSRREGALDFIVTLKRRDNDGSCRGKLRTNGGDGADSAHIREPEVHERDVRPKFPELFEGRLAGSRRPH